MKCPIIGELKSPTKRTCDAATMCRRISGLSQMCRMEVKEVYDPQRAKLGPIIHDPSLANDLYDRLNPPKVVTKIKKKPLFVPMSNEWSR